MADPTTANRVYPKPHPDNTLLNDVQRLSQAFDMIDADISAAEAREAQVNERLRRVRLNTLLNENLFLV
ncbi:MAG: hypothetical protein ACI8WB_003634 [Phenylobacterium sp.]|jgi:hypothetical protein